MATMPLQWGHFRVLIVGSMEQMIGAALSTIAGIVIPMLRIVLDPRGLSSLEQGIIGASGLVGIAIGSMVIGPMCDRYGYARFFRACALLITLGALLAFLVPGVPMLVIGLFITGFGVGGGYVLDSNYVSEVMPDRWKSFMVGVAKASCAIGFIAAAALCWWMVAERPIASAWPRLLLILVVAGALTFVMRIGFPGSPVWLMAHGRRADALAAARRLFGREVDVPAPPEPKSAATAKPARLPLSKVIFSGIPWACEGVGVYGVGVFLPIIVMALGIDRTNAVGVAKVVNSIGLTTLINLFILPGFVVGLLIVRRCYHVSMLTSGFWISAAGMALLLAAYLLHWPVWVSVLAFCVFEIALNAGPHLVTYIIPAEVYSIDERGRGSGLADMLGKLGAIAGVFFMPMLLHAGGVTLVLIVCIAVMVIGALISQILGPKVLPRNNN